MLKFIDIETGNVFNGTVPIDPVTNDVVKGIIPYTHWFDEGQSVNINYYKEIIFVTDDPTQSTIDITIEDNPYFKLMDFTIRNIPDPNDPTQTITIDPTQTENINGADYCDIDNFLVDSLHLIGIPFNGLYLYRFFVYAFSSDTGQYIVRINIDNEAILVGADFYPENELLTNDLETLGIEIPMQIQKAIYESNVHEEAMDNILMNRKWKELLLEYWNIVANKGSYKSLVNSMKFFEYGDLVRIMEYWKEHYNKDIFISNDIEQILNDRFREQLSVLSKSTYIGLYLALEKIVYDYCTGSGSGSGSGTGLVLRYAPTDWDIDHNDAFAQDNPILESVSTIWSSEDLSLKMTLLGNFFSTYFMPLHLDLIHSTIEDICFSNTIKIQTSASQQRRDYIDLGGNFLSSVKDGSNYYIEPQDVYVTMRTILGYKEFDRIIDDTTSNSGMGYDSEFDTGGILRMRRVQDESRYYPEVSILGVDTELDTGYGSGTGNLSVWDLIFSGANLIHKFGAIVPIDVKITGNVSDDDFLKSASIHWVKDGKELFDYVDNCIYVSPILDYISEHPYIHEQIPHYKYEFDFKLLFQNAGNYKIGITFTSSKGFEYTRKFEVNILDDADNPIHIYKVERVDPNEYKDLSITVDNDHTTGNVYITGGEYSFPLNDFMFGQTYHPSDLTSYQYICADIQNMQKNTGLNHVIMFVNANNGTNATIGGITANGATASSFSGFTDYWWFDMAVPTDFTKFNPTSDLPGVDIYDDLNRITGELSDDETVVVGIRKYFTIKSELNTLYERNFTKGNATGIVGIYQSYGMMHISVMYDNGDPGYIHSHPISDTARFTVFGTDIEVRIFPDWNWYVCKDGNNVPYGLEEDKLKCEGDFYRLVDEDRFIPALHRLVKVTEDNCEVLPSELMVAIPELKRTYTDYTDIVWEFLNSSTMEGAITRKGEKDDVNESGNGRYVHEQYDETNIDFCEPYLGKFKLRVLTPGYYNINLNYKYAGIQHKESRDAAFKIRKNYNG